MVTFEGDSWIALNSKISPEKLHALGVITYRWNVAEAALKVLLVNISGIEFSTLWAIIHEMGDVAIAASITELLKKANLPGPVAKAIEHGLKLYDANRINRNQLTHFLPTALVDSDFSRLKGPAFNPEPIPDDITDLRRVADDIGQLQTYMGALLNIVSSRQYSTKLGGALPQLPGTIPLPERLWKPPPPNPAVQKGRPQSSQG